MLLFIILGIITLLMVMGAGAVLLGQINTLISQLGIAFWIILILIAYLLFKKDLKKLLKKK